MHILMGTVPSTTQFRWLKKKRQNTIELKPKRRTKFWSNSTHLYLTWLFGISKHVIQRTGRRHCCPSLDLGLWGGGGTGHLNFQGLNIVDIETAWLGVNHYPIQASDFDFVQTSDLELVKARDFDRIFNSNSDFFARYNRWLLGRGGKLQDTLILQGALWAVIIITVIWK